jgi:response regulator RpfG family c-di-GMP phosphodiesterase
MQLDAIKSTSRIFKRFTSRHTVEKVEQLQESMCALQEDMMDISEILEQPVIGELNELMTLVENTSDHRVDRVDRIDRVDTLEFPEVPDRGEEGERVALAI